MQQFLIALILGFFVAGPAWVVLYPHKEVYRTLDIYEDKNGLNVLEHRRDLVGADFDEVVKPNNDTLYSLVSLDLSDGPFLLNIPAMGDRYWSVQFMATSTDVEAIVSRRNNGGTGGTYLLAAPGWTGDVPAGAEKIDLPSSRYWMLVRILVDGPVDLANVHALQDQLRLDRL